MAEITNYDINQIIACVQECYVERIEKEEHSESYGYGGNKYDIYKSNTEESERLIKLLRTLKPEVKDEI